MNTYFVIIPEGHNFGKVYVNKDKKWYNVSHKGNLTEVEILCKGINLHY